MTLYNKLPLYNLTIDEDDELGVNKISIVDYPAVESDFLLFEKAEQKEIKFAVQDASKHIVSGIAMVADRPIYRVDAQGKGYYVVFSKDTIEKIAHRFAKNNYAFNISLQHEQDVDNCYVCESFIINKERGICPKEFSEIEDGSWYTSVKIDDPALWEDIVNGDALNGFSVEIRAIAEEFSKVAEVDEKPKNWLEQLLSGNFKGEE